MQRKDMKEWVKEAIKKRYDKSDINDILQEKVQNKELSEEDYNKILELYDQELEETEMMKMSFFQRRKMRKTIRKLKDLTEKSTDEIRKLTDGTRKLRKNEEKKLENYRQQMIKAILGDKEKKQDGLIEIFEIEDEDGNELTPAVIQSYPIQDIEDLLVETLEQLEKEI